WVGEVVEGGAQIDEQGRGPGPGGRVVGDPGPGVGGGDRGVEHGPLHRRQPRIFLTAGLPVAGGGGEQDVEKGVQEQGATGQRIAGRRAGPVVSAPRQGQGQRVEVNAGGTGTDDGRADGVAEAGVLVVGVDD